MDFSQDQRQHLSMIQGVINGLAGKSFIVRVCTVVAVAAISASAFCVGNRGVALLAYPICLSFWVLDAYYLLMERLFRSLYSSVASSPKQTEVPLYSMDFRLCAKRASRWPKLMFSPFVMQVYFSQMGLATMTYVLIQK